MTGRAHVFQQGGDRTRATRRPRPGPGSRTPSPASGRRSREARRGATPRRRAASRRPPGAARSVRRRRASEPPSPRRRRPAGLGTREEAELVEVHGRGVAPDDSTKSPCSSDASTIRRTRSSFTGGGVWATDAVGTGGVVRPRVDGWYGAVGRPAFSRSLLSIAPRATGLPAAAGRGSDRRGGTIRPSTTDPRRDPASRTRSVSPPASTRLRPPRRPGLARVRVRRGGDRDARTAPREPAPAGSPGDPDAARDRERDGAAQPGRGGGCAEPDADAADRAPVRSIADEPVADTVATAEAPRSSFVDGFELNASSPNAGWEHASSAHR